MIYTTEQIAAMTRLAMGRNIQAPPLIRCRDPDVLPLDSIIHSKIALGAQRVYLSAPAELLHESARDITDDTLYWHESVDGLYSGHIRLPADFLRLLVYQMSDWRHAVHTAIDTTSPYYMAATEPYSGARGTPYRPVCLLGHRAVGRAIEFHSCTTASAQIVQAKYLAAPSIDPDGGIDIDSHIISDVITEIAALTLDTIGEYEKAKTLRT